MRTISILGTLLILAFGIVFFLSYISPLKKTSTQNISQNKPEAILFFSPEQIHSATNSALQSDIMLRTTSPVSLIQVDLSFNPEVIQNVSIKPAENNFFRDASYEVTLSEVREELGRITFTIELQPGVSEVNGEGAIATVSFTTNPFISQEASITFLNKSTVLTRKSRESLLKETVPLRLFFRNMNTPTTQLNESPVL